MIYRKFKGAALFTGYQFLTDGEVLITDEKGQVLEIVAGSGITDAETFKGTICPGFINTHCHLDHVFGNKYVAENFGLTLHLHQKEQAVLAYAPTSGLMYNMPFDNYQGPVNLLKEGDVISLGEDQLTCIETPGHSPGSLCFYSKTQGFVIGGDVLFKRGIGRTDLPFGSHETLLNSIREKLFVLPPETIVYPGHGPSTTIGEEIRENPFL